jgi:hypothetical protein
MLLGGGHHTTMGAGSGMAVMAGAGGPVPGCRPNCGVRHWLVFSAGITALWAGLHWHRMKGFSLGGGVEDGEAVLARTDLVDSTICGMGMWACGAFTAMLVSTAVLFLRLTAGSVGRSNALVLRRMSN